MDNNGYKWITMDNNCTEAYETQCFLLHATALNGDIRSTGSHAAHKIPVMKAPAKQKNLDEMTRKKMDGYKTSYSGLLLVCFGSASGLHYKSAPILQQIRKNGLRGRWL